MRCASVVMSQHRVGRGDRDGVSTLPNAAAMDLNDLLTLRTPRLDLIAATAESTTLEMQDIASFASALDVVPPASWPPPLHDAASQAWYLDLCSKTARSVGDCGIWS